MNREELGALIEEHWGVIAAFGDMSPIGNLARRTIRALEAALEQAHTPTEAHVKPFDTSPEPVKNGADSSHVTPTDDEREVLIALRLVSYPKTMSDGYPSGVVRTNEEAADLVLAAGFRRTVQGEPSDAYVRAVWDALGPGITVAFEYEELSAALRVAAASRQTGENR